jgi:hypothetical protein
MPLHVFVLLSDATLTARVSPSSACSVCVIVGVMRVPRNTRMKHQACPKAKGCDDQKIQYLLLLPP